jgi:hypothetical protein
MMDFTGVYLTGEFFSFMETTEESVNATAPILTEESSQFDQLMHFIHMNRGFVMIAGMVTVEWPKGII